MNENRRHPHVVNVSELEGLSLGNGKRFVATRKHLGMATASKGIGCTFYEVPAGKTAFPRHFHCANEESIYILEGEGSLRIGDDTVPVRSGDYATFPVGPAFAHQLNNTGSGALRYLCFSTLTSTEAVGYPDSKKIGVMAGSSLEAAFKGNYWLRLLAFESSAVGYYDGEVAE